MANAWMLKPLPNVGAVTTFGTLQAGDGPNLFNDYAGVVWQGACDFGGVDAAVVRFDLGADTLIDTMLIFGVELLPTGATMTVQYATAAQGYFTGGGAISDASGTPYAGAVMPVSGKGVALWSASAPVTARYFQIILYAGAAAKSVRLARIVIGKRIQLDRNFGYGGAFGVRDLGSLDFSARGVLLRRRAKKLRTVGLIFSNVRKDEVEATTKPLLEQIGNTEMIALLTDPAADAQRQNRAYFGPLVGDLGHIQRNAAGWETKVNLVSIF
jgi:hypothetical protein